MSEQLQDEIVFTEEQLSKAILIVDDEESQRVFLRRLLERAGFQNVRETSNGNSALVKLEREPYDLVLCDWMMPDISGYEILDSVRRNMMMDDLVFLMVTGVTDKDKVLSALQKGVDDYLVKPYDLKTLKLKLQNAFNKRLQSAG